MRHICHAIEVSGREVDMYPDQVDAIFRHRAGDATAAVVARALSTDPSLCRPENLARCSLAFEDKTPNVVAGRLVVVCFRHPEEVE